MAALPVVIAAAVFATCVAAFPTARVSTLRSAPVERRVRESTTRLLERLLRRPRQARDAEAVADDLPDLVDLLAVAAAAGASVERAVEVASRRHRGPAAAVLRTAIARAWSGERLGDSLAASLAARPPRVADAARPLVAVLIDSDRYGTPLGFALERLSADLRIHRRHRAEARARRVPVRLLLPLVLCVLPAFALLTVAPLLAGVARDALAEAPSTPLELPKELP
jgi:tight adherence protein C